MTLLELLGSGEFVKEAGATARSIIDGLFGWIPNRKNEEETKRKQEEVKLALAELENKLKERELSIREAAGALEGKLREVEFQLRVAVLTSKAGQFILYLFASITALQLVAIYLVYPFFPAMPLLKIPVEQWVLLFGILGMEKFADLKMRTQNKEGSK